MSNKLLKFARLHLYEITILFSSLVLYISTNSRSIVQGDSGDFLSAAATAGIPHPSGYPLYSLLSRIAFILPFGNPAWQVTILSAVFSSFSLVITYKIVYKLTKSQPAALFSVLCLGTFESFWFNALISQIHSLQVFLLSLLFYFLLSFVQSKKILYFYLSAFVFGLAVSNNHTIVFSLPAVIIVGFVYRKIFSVKKITIALGVSALGLLPYGYLIYAAGQNSPVSWGGVHDFTSFIRLVFRADYGTLQWGKQEPWAPFQFTTFAYFWEYLFQTSWFIIIFPCFSFYYWRKDKLVLSILLLTFLLTGPIFYMLQSTYVRNIVYQANSTQYYEYSYFFFSILSGLGVYAILHKYKLTNVLTYSLLVIIFFIPVFFFNLPRVRMDTNDLTKVTTQFQLSELPRNAIVITSADSISLPTRYWQQVVKYRPDVIIIDGGLLNFPWYRNHMKQLYPALVIDTGSPTLNYDQLCRVYAGKDRLFVSPWYPDFDSFFAKNCKLIPYGLVAKIIPKTRDVNIVSLKQFNDNEWKRYTSQVDLPKYKNYYLRTRETLFYVGEHKNYTGIYYMRFNKQDWAMQEFEIARTISIDEVNSMIGESAILYNRGYIDRGIEILETGIQENPAQPELFKNAGLFYQNKQMPEKVYEKFKTYVNFQPTTDPDLPGIMNYIKTYENDKMMRGN